MPHEGTTVIHLVNLIQFVRQRKSPGALEKILKLLRLETFWKFWLTLTVLGVEADTSIKYPDVVKMEFKPESLNNSFAVNF